MAFVFTVEDGSLVADANSYATVAEADDYYAVDPNFNATWTAYTDVEKEQRLAWSARVLDQKCRYDGSPVSATQAMRWPRTGVTDKDCRVVSSTSIPEQLKEAVLEHLKYAINNDPTTGGDIDQISQVVVDVIEITYQEGTSQTTVPNLINHILTGIGAYQIGSRGAGKIIKS